MQRDLVDAHVYARDGEVGTVWRVAMEPESRHVTHLVVHTGVLFGRNLVVPIENVARMEQHAVHLDLNKAEVEQLPDYQETDFLPPEDGWDYPVGYPPAGVIWPMPMSWVGASTYPLMSNAVVKENLPDEDVTLSAGADVECADGHCGRIEHVLVDDATSDVVGFVIKQGFFFTRDIEAPVSWVDHIDRDGRVHLKLSKRQVQELADRHDT